MKILLLEDEAALSDVIARNLRARGHDVRQSATVEAAVLSLTEVWPDALILDVNLPDMTGWDILRRLSPADRVRVGVIVISAAPLSQKRIEEFQPLRSLQKPFPMDALLRLLDDIGPDRAPATEERQS